MNNDADLIFIAMWQQMMGFLNMANIYLIWMVDHTATYILTSSPKGNDRSPESNVPSQSAPKPYAAFPPPQLHKIW